MRKLLDKQTVRIDDHKRGNKEAKKWNDQSVDVHIDKRTKYKIGGKIRHVTIRIPINSDREIGVEVDGKKNEEIPRPLYKEIRDALLNNREKANDFARDIITEVNNYGALLESEGRASAALNRLSKHFDLDWTKDKVATYVNESLQAYTQIYSSKEKKLYFMTLQPQYIELSDITRSSKHEIRLKRFE
ncbi:hypothetical protein V9K67_20695 [Paraflavisolibacter sp. H34]|uniref:hypothetical protein n=1 Tax=Huijunlia imazamoxiresistens TaxID=3127457 RepID=UPI003018E6FA